MQQSLLDKVSDYKFLEKAWDRLNKTHDNSHGLSDESIKSFKDNLTDKLNSISKKLKENSYHFSPYRATLIPKRDGKNIVLSKFQK